MNNKQAGYVISFFRQYNCFTNFSDEELQKVLLETPTDGSRFAVLINVNNSYVTHEIKRKVPTEVLKYLKRTNSSWIHNILLEYDRCPVCNSVKKSLSNTTCSTSCANTFFRSGIDNPNHSNSNYRAICFSWHKKECVICGESGIVEVHHLDENHNNNDPANLVPLCPTHHKYWHSAHKKLIEQQVFNYVKDFKHNS
jgi:hypothetical protein